MREWQIDKGGKQKEKKTEREGRGRERQKGSSKDLFKMVNVKKFLLGDVVYSIVPVLYFVPT